MHKLMIKPYLIAGCALLALASCKPQGDPDTAPEAGAGKAPAQAQPAASDEIGCSFPVDGNRDNAASVLARFGKDAQRATIGGPEGSEFAGIVLWKDDPARKIELVFDDESQNERIAVALVRSPQSQWRIAGIGIGDDLGELVRANGATVSFWGFGWDYGGNVIDLAPGKLDELAGGCEASFQLDLALSETDLPTGLLGEVKIRSDDKRLAGRKIAVREIGLHWR